MKKLAEQFIVFVFMVAAVSGVSAQNAASAGITDSDVTAFIRNFDKINAEFKKYDVELAAMEPSMAEEMKGYADVESFLERIGISGPSRAYKITVISMNYAYIALRDETDADTLAMMKTMGTDPLAQIKPYTNEKDMGVVMKHKSELKKLFDSVSGNDE
jgi:hypothetical protein